MKPMKLKELSNGQSSPLKIKPKKTTYDLILEDQKFREELDNSKLQNESLKQESQVLVEKIQLQEAFLNTLENFITLANEQLDIVSKKYEETTELINEEKEYYNSLIQKNTELEENTKNLLDQYRETELLVISLQSKAKELEQQIKDIENRKRLGW